METVNSFSYVQSDEAELSGFYHIIDSVTGKEVCYSFSMALPINHATLEAYHQNGKAELHKVIKEAIS